MASVFKPRRGTAVQHSTFTGVSGEVTLDTTNRRWLYHDGSTVGGLTIGGTGSEASNSYVTSTFTTNTVFQSALANTNLAISDRMQVANAQALFNTLQANLVSTTNVQTRATWSALIATNTDIRSLVSDRLQVANATATYATISTVNSNLANTNARLSTNETDISNLQTEDGNLWSAITATNTAIRSLVTSNDTDISNLQTEDGNLWSAITATNTAIRSLVTSNDTDISNLQTEDGNLWSGIAGTNTAIRTLVNNNLANTNAEIDLLNTNLTNTNTAIRALISSNDTDISNLQTEDSNLWSSITATNTAIRSITTTNANKISQVESNLLATNTSIRSAISTEVASLVDSAPATLDTLNELAAALDDDANFSTTVTNSIATKMSVANTNTLVNDRMQVANTNTLVNDRMQVANTQALHSSITANLNSYIANTNPRLTTLEAQVGGTTVSNTSFQSYIANTNPRIANFNSSGQVIGSIVPAANVTYDLGTEELSFRDLYLSGSTISVGGTTISGNSSGIFISDTGSGQNVQISSTQGIVVNGVQLADETGSLDPDAIGQGFNESTVYEIPNNFGSSENYVGESGSSSDAFGVNIGGTIYDCMEPVGRFATTVDYGSVA